ncbi:MAG: hypothetical protein HW421_3334 [Ignavibacteria bacterium]|nr:hypothetical protein [Ignavibacteria bacterium]
MKTKLLLVTFFIITSLPAFSQVKWYRQVFDSTFNYTGICFTDSLHGWISISGKDTILRTTDGGANWVKLPLINKRIINGLHFIDSLYGWAICPQISLDYYPMLYTSDGGDTWIERKHEYKNPIYFYSIYFSDVFNGWMCGYTSNPFGGVILRTTNGGNNWIMRNFFSNQPGGTSVLYKIKFIDNYIGYAVGSNSVVLSTIDGGSTWHHDDLNDAPGISLQNFHFKDASTGWAIGSGGSIYFTANGGNTWKKQYSNTNTYLYGIKFLDSLNGWVVGYSYNPFRSLILHTSDGGNNWETELANESSHYLLDIAFPTPTRGFAVGYNIILSTIPPRILPKPKITLFGKSQICLGDTVILIGWPSSNEYSLKWSTGDTTSFIRVDKEGLYTLTAKNIYGDLDTTSVYITVFPLPQVGIIPEGKNTICKGDSIILKANENFAGYQWSNGSKSGSIVVKNSGTFSLTVVDTNGCVATSKVAQVEQKTILYNVTPTKISFDTVAIGRDSTMSIVVKNYGDSTIKVDSIYFKAPTDIFPIDFSTPLPAILKYMESMNVNVKFVPKDSIYYIDSLYVSITEPCPKKSMVVLSGAGKLVSDVNEFNNNPRLNVNIQPNPANTEAIICIELGKYSNINLILNDILGNVILEIFNGNLPSGKSVLKIDASSIPSGIYNLSIQAGQERYNCRLAIIK